MSQFVIPGVAVIISIISLIVSIRYSKRNLETSISPTLVFVRYDDDWKIENIGNGPALNVIIFAGSRENWLDAKQYYPVPAGVRMDIPKMSIPRARLGASYEDTHGNKYSSICEHYHTNIFRNDHPEEWKEVVPEVVKFLKSRAPIQVA